jgi:hypothetical protein
MPMTMKGISYLPTHIFELESSPTRWGFVKKFREDEKITILIKRFNYFDYSTRSDTDKGEGYGKEKPSTPTR